METSLTESAVWTVQVRGWYVGMCLTCLHSAPTHHVLDPANQERPGLRRAGAQDRHDDGRLLSRDLGEAAALSPHAAVMADKGCRGQGGAIAIQCAHEVLINIGLTSAWRKGAWRSCVSGVLTLYA